MREVQDKDRMVSMEEYIYDMKIVLKEIVYVQL